VVARAVGLADALADADLCLTGEGRLDGQTRAGKAPAVVAAACGTAGVPCVGLFGAVDVSSAEARAMGFMQARSIASAPRPRAEALAATSADLASAAAEVVALRASS
jgi:glycerate kinase